LTDAGIDLREMLRALTLYPWLNTAEKRHIASALASRPPCNGSPMGSCMRGAAMAKDFISKSRRRLIRSGRAGHRSCVAIRFSGAPYGAAGDGADMLSSATARELPSVTSKLKLGFR